MRRAIAELEHKPDSEGRKLLLQEAVAESRAHDDPKILQAAKVLLELVKAQPGGEKHARQIAHGNFIAHA